MKNQSSFIFEHMLVCFIIYRCFTCFRQRWFIQ